MDRRHFLILAFLLLLGAIVSLIGINWGLPSHAVDPYLFGDRAVWPGEKILRLAGPTENPNRGADVASHAFQRRDGVVEVNATDEERARIVRRYRLMSYQPDEWNTLKALSEMKPGRGDFDPKLYQYGGLWVYPIGVLLKIASALHLIDLHSDVTFYLDRPEAFGRFYIVARCWSAAWGLAGIAAVYVLVRRITAGHLFPAIAALCFMAMPVVVDMAHEAKPHLAGSVLMLLAVLAAARFVESGSRRAGLAAGALCGAAFGMVLTAWPIFFVLVGMVFLRPLPRKGKIALCAAAIFLGVAVYAATNPYVPYNFIFHREVLESNLGNSKAMYHPRLTGAGIRNAAFLIAAGTSPLLALAGAGGAIGLGLRAVSRRRDRSPAEIRRRSIGLLLALPALFILGQCLFFADGKPGEFGRFMLFVDIFLMIEALVAIATFVRQSWMRRIIAAGLFLTTAVAGASYLHGFWRDSQPKTSRLIAADQLRAILVGSTSPDATVSNSSYAIQRVAFRTVRTADQHFPAARNGPQCGPYADCAGLSRAEGFLFQTGGSADTKRALDERPSLAVYADPAPYCLPPVDLFRWKILLPPKNGTPDEGIKIAEASIEAVDVPPSSDTFIHRWLATPISWANKKFDLREWTAPEAGPAQQSLGTAKK